MSFSNFQHISILLPAEESCGIGQCLFDYIDYYMTLKFFFEQLSFIFGFSSQLACALLHLKKMFRSLSELFLAIRYHQL